MGNVSNSYFWNALCISQILKIGTFPVITFSLKGPVKGVFFSLKVWDSILTTGKVLCRHSQALCGPKIFSHSSLESVGKFCDLASLAFIKLTKSVTFDGTCAPWLQCLVANLPIRDAIKKFSTGAPSINILGILLILQLRQLPLQQFHIGTFHKT